MAVIAIVVKLSSPGPVLYWSDRVRHLNHIFRMPKFRSKTSLDELPQIVCILNGEVSFVGPRPALFYQDDLVKPRSAFGIHHLTPGLTGWAASERA